MSDASSSKSNIGPDTKSNSRRRKRSSRGMSSYINRMYKEQEKRRNSQERKQKLLKRYKCFSCCIN